jgi:LCP family protein required for cell wall assembly
MTRKTIIYVLSFLICLLTAGGVGVGYAAYQKVKNIQPDDLLNNSLNVHKDGEIITPKDDSDYVLYNGEKYSYNEDIITLLLIGIDKDSDRSSARSDVMVVCAIDSKNNTVKMIVCPRDTQTTVRHTDSEGKETKTSLTKLNHSFPYGGGNEDRDMGAKNVMYNVSQVLSLQGKYSIPITHYGGLDMSGIGPLTSAVDGVTITLPETVSGVGSKNQTITLNATTATRYCTARKGVSDGSDVSRGQRQMVYLMGLVEKIKSISPTQIPSLFTQLNKHVFTNISTDEMVAYAKLLAKIDLGNIEPLQLQGNFIRTDASYYVLDEDKLEEMIINIFYEKLDDGSTPNATVTSEADDTATFTGTPSTDE